MKQVSKTLYDQTNLYLGKAGLILNLRRVEQDLAQHGRGPQSFYLQIKDYNHIVGVLPFSDSIALLEVMLKITSLQYFREYNGVDIGKFTGELYESISKSGVSLQLKVLYLL